MNSVISIDLGGENTGFFSYTSNDFNNLKNFQSGTIAYDNSFVLSQEKRRTKRHSKRNSLRRKFAKRLFLLILKKHYNLKINLLPDSILGLFNKRGYTYATLELNEQQQFCIASDILKDFLNENLLTYNISKDLEVEEFLNQIASNEEIFLNYQKDFSNLLSKSTHAPKNKLELTDEIKNLYDNKEDEKELFTGLRAVEKLLNEFNKEQNQGNLPREKYFIEIIEEVNHNQEIQDFIKNHTLNNNEFINLVGNISNLQLKELRRYFNDKNMIDGDIWIEDKLYKIVWRFIASWHPKKDVMLKSRQDALTDKLKRQNIIDFLTSTKPLETIPPYDDMNNRGAVKCHSLRLNHKYLDKHLENWKKIANKLASENLEENLEACTTNESFKELTLFHRILDTSSNIDQYKLRDFNIENYIDILGKEDATKLLNFTKHYYEMITKKVRTGIWQKKDDIFLLCDHNPPYKNNQIHTLVGAILGTRISEEKLQNFENTLWKEKFGNKKLSSYCKNIEEARKKKGNLFKIYLEELNEIKKPNAEQKKDIKLLSKEQLLTWADKVADFFEIDTKIKNRFQNHFSMAQLYTIIETRRSGFMSTCKWCTAENSFRSNTNLNNYTLYFKDTGEEAKDTTFNEEIHLKVYEYSNAQRLPADTQRPFSGKIERYIDKIGYEISKIKEKELKNTQENEIDLKIILEQNSFEYEESLISAKIKKANTKAKKALEDNKRFFEKSLDDKENRIKNFNNSICMYCNLEITNNGEIDHILPRSYTLKNYGTIFNSEGNLLYVHQNCNQAKKDKIYKIEDIKTNINIKEVENEIENIKSYKTFSILNAKQQKAFKYSLFLPCTSDAFKKVLNFLRTDQSSRVNGTQKYLAKKVQEKLIKMFPSKTFNFDFILASSEDVSRLRKYYAKQNPILAKPKGSKQAPSSHTIDSIIALSSVHKKVGIEEQLTSEDILKFVQINNITTKPLGKLQKEKIGNLGNGAIFKDSIYQEKFAPIYYYENKLYTGFLKASKILNFSNCAEVKEDDFHKIKDYLSNAIIKKNGLKIYQIDKKKTLTLFHDVSSNHSNNLQVAKILDKFAYNVIKTSVKNGPKILNDNKKMCANIYKKNICLPIKDEWLRFDNFLKANLKKQDIEYKENKGEYQIDDNIFLLICKEYFNITNKEYRNKARKVFSLPIAESPSGGFRIRRKNYKDEYIYQLVAIDGAKSIGFEIKNENINTSKDVLLPTLAKSKNVSSKEPAKKEIFDYIDMNQFRDLSSLVNLDNIKIYVAPASKSRPLVRVELNLNIFKKIIKNDSLNFLEIDNIELTNGQKNEFNEVFYSCNFEPRDAKIKVLKADSQKILIEFSNKNKTIMNNYSNAPDINLNE